jgi:Zn-finger nucleic acid-binding protein
MKCVKCSGKLVTVTLEGMAVDQCPQCRGIWFDLGELKTVLEQEDLKRLQSKLKGRRDAKRDRKLDAKKGPCPRCGGRGNMVPVNDAGHDIHIDTCLVCYGQWLDGGELEILREKGVYDTVAGFFKRMLG